LSDTGIGIAPDFLPHVQRFRQGDPGARARAAVSASASVPGSWWKCTAAPSTCRAGGRGRGATFRVKVPLTIVHPGLEAGVRVHPRTGQALTEIAAGDLSGVHVLAVEDECDALALVVAVLETAGARVRTAQSAEEALVLLDGELPDVVVADLGMPGLDGYQFIDQVRRHRNRQVRDLPAAALTARPEDRMKALRAGFHIHLAKPIDPAELVTTVAALARRFIARPDDERHDSVD
jgi:CheY-like chemotaxis protein